MLVNCCHAVQLDLCIRICEMSKLCRSTVVMQCIGLGQGRGKIVKPFFGLEQSEGASVRLLLVCKYRMVSPSWHWWHILPYNCMCVLVYLYLYLCICVFGFLCVRICVFVFVYSYLCICITIVARLQIQNGESLVA